MLIIKETYERCPKCNKINRTITKAIYGCDNCKEKFVDINSLEVTVFHKGKSHGTKAYQFCSWKCIFEFLSKIKAKRNISFIILPYLYYGKELKGGTIRDLLKLIK